MVLTSSRIFEARVLGQKNCVDVEFSPARVALHCWVDSRGTEFFELGGMQFQGPAFGLADHWQIGPPFQVYFLYEFGGQLGQWRGIFDWIASWMQKKVQMFISFKRGKKAFLRERISVILLDTT